jgi:hypothetical protein
MSRRTGGRGRATPHSVPSSSSWLGIHWQTLLSSAISLRVGDQLLFLGEAVLTMELPKRHATPFFSRGPARTTRRSIALKLEQTVTVPMSC